MAYCTKCGRELISGQACICQRNLQGDARLRQSMGNAAGGRAQQSTGSQVRGGVSGQSTGGTVRPGAGSAAGRSMGGTMRPGSDSALHQSMGNAAQQNIGGIEHQNMGNAASQNFDNSAQQNAGNVPQQNLQSLDRVKQQSMFLANNIIEIFLKVLKSPISAGRVIVKSGNVAIGVSLIIMQAIFTGLFGCVMVSKINGFITRIASKGLGDGLDDGLDSLLEFASVSMVKFSYMKGFLISAFGSVALSFIIALMAMLLLMAFKGSTSYSKMLAATGIRCVGMMPVTVLAVIVSVINVWWGIMFFMLSSVIGLIFMGRVLSAGTVVNENKMPYVIFILVLLTLIVQIFMISKVWPFYLPDLLRASYDEMLQRIRDEYGSISGMFRNFYNYTDK